MDLSIVIPHLNRKELLERCLCSIPQAVAELSYETIVVDNGSKDGSQQRVKERFPHVSLLQNKKNEGFSRATNRGLHGARGEYCLCINNDTVLSPHSLETLVSFMRKHPEAGVSGGKILNRDGTLQPSARSFPRIETALFNRSSLLSRLFPQNPFSRRYLLTDWDHNSVREVDWVSGSFFLIRREVLQKVGCFDERFFLYCEDVDYCKRVKEAGYRVFYVPEAQLLHDTGYSGKKVSTLFFHHQSMYRFYKKYEARGPLWDMTILGGIALRFLAGISLLATRKLFDREEHGSSS
ncbi:MAG: glycosyltransferase family 2 protein [Candidatus Omnitrophica bacterium]|nr:glycosyltransferase family 2 protein [Candidatus Omnitrophota bacterium]